MATFITSKSIGQTILTNVQTSTGYWKYNHNGSDSSVFADGEQTITVANANGEFTLIPCLSDGTPSGNLTELVLINNQLTSFTGTGLSSLTGLNLNDNQLTTFDGTDLTSLIGLDLENNQLASFDGTDLSSLTYLQLYNNQLTSFDGTGLTSLIALYLDSNQLASFDGTDLTSLTELHLSDNGLTSLDGFILPTSLTNLELNENQLTTFDEPGLTSLTYLNLSDNGLTSLDGFILPTSLTGLSLNNNQLTSFDGTDLSSLTTLMLNNNQLTSINISGLTVLQSIITIGNPLTPSINNSLLAQLAANELANDWNSGEFYTTGGRTSAGTTDYDYLIANGWEIEGVSIYIAPVPNKLNSIYRRFISTSTDIETIDRILDKGLVYNSESEGQEAIYVIGSSETFLRYVEAVGLGSEKISIYGSESNLIQTEENWSYFSEWQTPSRENDSFLPSVMKIKSLMDNDQVLMDKGIIEFDSKIDSEGTNYGEISILDRFLIKQLPSLLGNYTYDIVIGAILDKGIVIHQHPNGTSIMASIETYLKYDEFIRNYGGVPA